MTSLNKRYTGLLPFLGWFPLTAEAVKINFLAGLTVALVLIPQSMAYAQLAGMPAYYGLYAAFLPVLVAALWGSSNQLASGPSATISLMTAAALVAMAPVGSDEFIALAIMVTFLVGLIQLALGLLKLGVIVNFLSHPVIVGFIAAVGVIIGLSQIPSLLGVSKPRSESLLGEVFGVFMQISHTHGPTLAMGAGAIVLILALKKVAPRMPGVLIAVALTTLVSWAIGFEKTVRADIGQVADAALLAHIKTVAAAAADVQRLQDDVSKKNLALSAALKADGENSVAAVQRGAELALARLALANAEAQSQALRQTMRRMHVVRQVDDAGSTLAVYAQGMAPAGAKLAPATYRVSKVTPQGAFLLVGGGAVVGQVPQGLPRIAVPALDLDKLASLFTAALVIALVGFMQTISLAKAVAAKTRQRVDSNQELIGQGLAHLAGSFAQSYPVSASASRTAINASMGATCGLAAVFTALVVVLTLLFLTPLLYHLPQAVLAAVIVTSIGSLVDIEAAKHAWRVHKHDGIVVAATFCAALLFAPNLNLALLTGAGLAILLYLYRTMKPRVSQLGRHPDGELRDLLVYPDLPTSAHVVALRFDDSVYFANAPYFEDAVLGAVANKAQVKYVLVVGHGINQLDTSGEQVMRHLVERLRSSGVVLVFCGLKKQVLDVMRRTGLFDVIGADNLFPNDQQALTAIYARLGPLGQGELLPAPPPSNPHAPPGRPVGRGGDGQGLIPPAARSHDNEPHHE